MATVALETTSGGIEASLTFDPEFENPVDFQRAGWQAILDNFKRNKEA